jgi:hypothetical protein
VIVLLLVAALAAEPTPPVDGPPAPAEDEPGAPPDAVLATLADDLETWGGALAVRTRRLSAGAPSAALRDEHELALRLVLVRLDLAEVRLATSDPPAGDGHRVRLAQARAAVALLVQAAVEARMAADLQAVDAALVRGQDPEATALARAALAFADTFRDRMERPGRVEPAIVLLARVIGRVDRAGGRAAAAACARRCVDPDARAAAAALIEGWDADPTALDPLAGTAPGPQAPTPAPTPPGPTPRPPPPPVARVRVGASVVAPLPAGTFEGAQVRRGFSGTFDAAYAGSSAGCVAARLGSDAFLAVTTGGEVRVARLRGELGWCPRLAAVTVGQVGLSLRAVLGVGVARTVLRRDDVPTVLAGLGPAGRIEVPVTLGPIEVIPEVGLSPYGRAASLVPGAARTPLRMLDRAWLGIGVQAAFGAASSESAPASSAAVAPTTNARFSGP